MVLDEQLKPLSQTSVYRESPFVLMNRSVLVGGMAARAALRLAGSDPSRGRVTRPSLQRQNVRIGDGTPHAEGAELDEFRPRPHYVELLAVIGLGVTHVVVEVTHSLAMARIYNTVALMLGLAYLIWRAAIIRGIAYQWGLRIDNFWAAVRSHSAFWVPATAVLLLWGAAQGKPLVPRTIWIVLLLYPFFGIAQQFVLQNLLASNLRALIPKPLPCAFVAALLFGLAHLPRTELSAAAFIAGLCLTLTHQRQPNLFAVGVIHGCLAALFFYFVLDSDPGARIFESLSSAFAALRSQFH